MKEGHKIEMKEGRKAGKKVE